MTACINRNLKEFKSLASEFNVDEFFLEILCHEYNNTVGSATAFLTDSGKRWLRSKINGVSAEVGPGVFNLWNTSYSTPKVFNSVKEANKARLEALKFFPSKSVTLVEQSDGSMRLTVAKPTNYEYEKRLQDILDNAPRNEQGRLLAPNGKVSNLTPRQYAQVRTKEFKDWFGDWENDSANASKVVDENGEPLVVYHGGAKNIAEFRTGTEYYHITDNGKVADDSSIAMFFSDGKSVGKFYRGLYGSRYYEKWYKEAVNDVFSIFDSHRYQDADGITRYTDFSKEELNKMFSFCNSLYKLRIPKLKEASRRLREYFTNIKDKRTDGINSVESSVQSVTTFITHYLYQDISSTYANSYIGGLEGYEKSDGTEEGDATSLVYESQHKQGDLYPVFLNMKNPSITDYNGERLWGTSDLGERISIQANEAKNNGNDGVIYKNIEDPYIATNYGVFSSSQIKSAESNKGTFSNEDNNIYYEDESATGTERMDNRLRKLAPGFGEVRRSIDEEQFRVLIGSTKYEPLMRLLDARLGEDFFKNLSVEFVDLSKLFVTWQDIKKEEFNGKRAYYDAKANKIVIDISAGYANGDASSVIMHEVMHAATVSRILGNERLKKEFLHIIKEFQNAVKKDWEYSGEHGIEEFIADIWTNPRTIAVLQSIPYKDYKGIKLSFWDKIKNVISKIFYVPNNKTLFSKASDLVAQLLEETVSGTSSDRFFDNSAASETNTENSKTIFTTSSSNSYPQRTKENADWSDVTLALAVDFNTAGERLTKKVAGNKYIDSPLPNDGRDGTTLPIIAAEYYAEEIAKSIKEKSLPTTNIKLNIAGNGIYTLSSYTQEEVNDYVTALIKELQTLGVTISAIRSGGQTGIDEAGIIAAQRLGIPSEVHTTANWMFRGKDGKDISSETDFKARFEQTTSTATSEISAKEPLPTSDTKINIDVSTNENSELSNFAERPFDFRKGYEDENSKAYNYFMALHPILPITANSVEQALQYFKLAFALRGTECVKEYWGEEADVTDPSYEYGDRLSKAIFDIYKSKTAAEAKRIGDSVELSKEDAEFWDKHSAEIMKFLILQSFKQNPQAAQKLIATGNATLTSTQDSGKSETEFLRVLMEVRDMLAKGSEVSSTEEAFIDVSEATSQQDTTDKEHEQEQSENEDDAVQEFIEETPEQKRMRERSERIEKFLQAQAEFYKQLQAIQEESSLSSTEIRDVAAQVVYAISDLLTEIQQGKRDINSINPLKQTTADASSMSRAELLQFIGVEEAFDYVKEQLFSSMNNLATKFVPPSNPNAAAINAKIFETTKAIRAIINNFRAIQELSSEEFVNIEGFGLSFAGYTIETVEGIEANIDDVNEDEDAASIIEREGDLQEHWQVNFRTVDVLGSMSQLVRQALLQCYKLDSEGNPIVSRFGIKERVSAREATNQILRWTRSAVNMETMIDALREHSEANPWINQIISRLEKGDKTLEEYGADTDFRSQFYSVFAKHFQLYDTVVLDSTDGYYINTVNEHPALDNVIQQVQLCIAANQVPMFTTSGISAEKFDELEEAITNLKRYTMKDFKALSKEDVERLKTTIQHSLGELGAILDESQINENWDFENYNKVRTALFNIKDVLKAHLGQAEYDPFAFKGGIKGNLSIAISPFLSALEDISASSFHEDGKTYQSYVTPSYLTKFMRKMGLKDESFDKFIEDEFGKYDWFKDQETGEWKNPWLKAIVENRNKVGFKVSGLPYEELFAHKVQLNFNKHSYFKKMSPSEYTLSVLAEFFAYNSGGKEDSHSQNSKDVVAAWYRVPIMSNKPSSEFIRFVRYNDFGVSGEDGLYNYQVAVINGLMDVFSQELSRIQTVRKRNKLYKKGSKEYIKNFDTNGAKFAFLKCLNNTNNATLKALIDKKVGTETSPAQTLTEEENATLDLEARKELVKDLRMRTSEILDKWKSEGIYEEALKLKGINKSNIEAMLTNFIWNDRLACMMIEEMFVTDIALYKDTEDLQKRLAQIHAPGVRGDVNAVDYNGVKVSDGTFRTILLKDFDYLRSNIIENLKVVFDRKIESMSENQRASARSFYDSILKEFENIDVANAQGYSCPTSRRKKDFIMGLWSREKEAIYNRIINNSYTDADLAYMFDLSMASEPEKPFCYSQIERSSNLKDSDFVGELGEQARAPMKNFKMGVQYKNSEYLLIMADAILRGEETGRGNLLRAIYDFMEDTAFDGRVRVNGKIIKFGEYNGKGVDTVQFESASKAMNQANVDINQFIDVEDGEQLAYEALLKSFYKVDENNNLVTTEVNGSIRYVQGNISTKEVPFEDWCLQQQVPNHLYDHAQAHGSQTRMILPSGLAHEWEGKPCVYTVYGEDFDAESFRERYENIIKEGIDLSIKELSEDLGLDLKPGRQRNAVIAEILQREIKSSPRYGTDLLKACTIDPATGEFMIPLGDPIQAKRIEQLINSIIKNRVNKQEIAGGPVVQVSSYGLSESLNIRYYKKDGKEILKSKQEWEADNKGYKTYSDYCKDNQGGVAYHEIYIGRLKQFEQFEDENGNIDIEEVRRIAPELLDAIAYRIPTEDKYSMAPCKIVGFLPKPAGAGIMMPAEITNITGCDFDVDKMYVMLKEFKIVGKGKRRKCVSYAKGTREYINNYIVEMTRVALTHLAIADKLLSPGSFAAQKVMGYKVKAFANYKSIAAKSRKRIASPNAVKERNRLYWEKLEALAEGKLQLKDGVIEPYNAADIEAGAITGVDALKVLSYKESDLSYFDTQVQFYKQNSAAGSILAIFAVAKVAHATLEGNRFRLNLGGPVEDGGVGLTTPFKFAGHTIGSCRDMTVELDPVNDVNGNYIGKSLGSLVSASADAVKDPVLNLMNINKETVNVLNTLIRIGIPFEDAALLLSQKVVSDALQEYYKVSLTTPTNFADIISKKLREYTRKGTPMALAEDLSTEMLIDGVKSSSDAKAAAKTLYIIDKVFKMSNALKGINFATRFNSISNAVGPLVIDNLIKEYKCEPQNFNQIEGLYNKGISGVLDKHPILKGFHETLSIARKIFKSFAPEHSSSFNYVLEDEMETPSGMKKVIMNNRQVLNKFSDFFKTYITMRCEAIHLEELDYYVNNFAADFYNFKINSTLNNELISALRVSKDKDGALYINIDSSILNDQTRKERLSAAWIDLLKQDKKMAIDLFKYCLFRGGIGFTPRTFMSLVPVELKMAISGYVEAFRDVDAFMDGLDGGITPPIVDMFVQNNYNNKAIGNSICPTKKITDKNGTPLYQQEGSFISISSSIANSPYFKAKDENGNFTIYKKAREEFQGGGEMIVYTELQPLGANGSFIQVYRAEETPAPLEKASSAKNFRTTVDASDTTLSENTEQVQPEFSDDTDFVNEFTISAKLEQERFEKEKALEALRELDLETPKDPLITGAIENVQAMVELSTEEIEEHKDKQDLCGG